MTINWDQVEETCNKYKVYAADGKYDVKCDDVEVKEVGQNGSVVMKFHFEDAPDVSYPTADHWLSFKNENWRVWHNKCLMVLLGATEENARKAVEVCESKNDRNNIVKAYEQTYKKLLAKKPQVNIEVYTDINKNTGKEYARAEFTDRSVAMPKPSDSKMSKADDGMPTSMEEAEEISIDDLPF